MSSLISWSLTVGDYSDTEYGELFSDFEDDHPVAVAFDEISGMYCAIAYAAGQTVKVAESTARQLLEKHIHEHLRPAGK